ncbi:MAG TPA: response regulator [Patescibacteria group bacterium]|nr:response regulator [Patescibacteria group bacterium]
MKVLLIDDDEATAMIFATALKKEGFETEHAPNGKEGIEKARNDSPNLILLDQILPDIQGNEVLRTLKADEKTKNIPVVLLSNFSQEELVKEAINAGAVDYVAKYQVETNDVVEKVKEVLKA